MTDNHHTSITFPPPSLNHSTTTTTDTSSSITISCTTSTTTSRSDIEDTFLRACRNGDLTTVTDYLRQRDQGLLSLDVSCKGQSKSNLGWTPLHLATYFGHRDVAEQLLAKGAAINAVNDNGDTPLHKASFIGREDLVMLLIQYNADVSVINGEGRLPRDMTPSNEVGDEIAKLLRAAETTEALRKESRLLSSARDGDIATLQQLLKDPSSPPNINCVDVQGNSSLHCAAYRGHKEAAVLLLQNGIDTAIRNQRGQLALDLARDAQTLQVLSVKSARRVQKTATRFEGPLLKRSRFLGWKPVWAVLERGVLNYYASRADSTADVKRRDGKRKDYKYLDGAKVSPIPSDQASFVVHFNDGALHRLGVVVSNGESAQVERQRWINAFNEHAAFSAHYLWGLEKRCSSEEEIATRTKPLGCMTDALGSASASFEVLQRQMGECAMMVEALQKSMDSADCSSALPVSALMVGHVQLGYLRFQVVSETAANMMASLQHCLTLFHQQEDVRVLQLRQEQEKCRVLEEALNVLAKEHHELEQSVANHISETGTIPRSFSCKSSRIFDTDEEFFDADFNEDSDTDTLVQGESIFNTPSGSVLTLFGEEQGDQDERNWEPSSERKSRRRLRRRSTESGRELLSSSTATLTQYFTDEGAPDVSQTSESSSSSSTTPSSSTATSSTESATLASNSHPDAQSTESSYYTQPCDGEDHRLVLGNEEEEGGEDSQGNSEKSESNSSSDTLVGTMSNATSCATLISEGGNVYRCARDASFYEDHQHHQKGVERDLICLKTPVQRR